MVPILLLLFETKVKKKSDFFSLIHSEIFIKHLLCASFSDFGDTEVNRL